MSTRLDVLNAVVAMIRRALPEADVIGLDDGADAPDTIGPSGRVIVRPGDPGDPEIDLSPVIYNYLHPIPVEFASYGTDTLTPSKAVDAMLEAVSAEIEGDRFLGGLVDYLDATAPETADLYTDAATVAHEAAADIVATYSTPHPL
jgi:hypothetical protein